MWQDEPAKGLDMLRQTIAVTLAVALVAGYWLGVG